MPSMSYCRFQNLLADLRAVKPHFSGEDLSADEEAARLKVLRIMAEIVEDHRHYLTRRERDYTERHTAQYCPQTAAEWQRAYGSGVYYLSDGGISRIGYYKGKLYLTDNSSWKAKDSWDLATEMRLSIEHDFYIPEREAAPDA